MKRRVSRSFLSTLLLGLLLVQPVGAAEVQAACTDIGADSWYAEAVEQALTTGLMSQTSASAFSPDRPLTYAELKETLAALQSTLPSGSATLDQDLPADGTVTRRDMVAALYDLALQGGCVEANAATLDAYADASAVASSDAEAFRWAVSVDLIQGTPNACLDPDATVTRAQLACTAARLYERLSHYDQLQENGLTVTFPSAAQTTICQGRDFYVIGRIDTDIHVPDRAKMELRLTDASGTVYRDVSADVKDNRQGLYVDYDQISYSGDREELRGACIPDLVYDPAQPETFTYTWNKCYYTDDRYAAVIHGGTYSRDTSPYDQNGKKLEPLPEGGYTLSIELTDGQQLLASATQQLVIGDLKDKVLSRFSPDDHMARVQAYAGERGYTLFLDPFPGYWNTSMFLPDWGMDYELEIPAKWALADREEYHGGRVHFFIYNVTENSTSYSVEIGQMELDQALDDPARLECLYYDIGEPFLPNTGTDGTFTPFAQNAPVVFTRVDRDIPGSRDNYLDLAVLPDTQSDLDLSDGVIASPGQQLSLYGVCKPIQSLGITHHDNETFDLPNRVYLIDYYLDYGGHWDTIEKEIGLTRRSSPDNTSTSILEFKHDLLITEDMKGQDVKVHYTVRDAYGNMLVLMKTAFLIHVN